MKHSATILIALTCALAACGGGGGDMASTPPPAPVPTPSPSPTPGPTEAGFFASPPATQEFTTFTSGSALRIRYDAQTRRYEVMAPGHDWEEIHRYSPAPPGNYRIPGPMEDVGEAFTQIRPDHPDPTLRFHYSTLATWTRGFADEPAGRQGGLVAFGVPTPAGGVPLTGSATYAGHIAGSASIPAKSGWGDWDRAPISGTASLRFDFANGALSGEIRPLLGCDCDQISFPTLAFADTVFAAGSRTYSGRFATGEAGPNAFSGLFTGPQAQELIGKWAFPFRVAGVPHSAEGVWVAKRD